MGLQSPPSGGFCASPLGITNRDQHHMNNLFLALLLLSLGGLVVGLINPPLFRMKSRKQAGSIFAGAAIVFFVLFGVTSGNSTTAPVTATVAPTEAASSAPAVTTTKATTAPATPAPTTAAPVASVKPTTKAPVATPAPTPAPAPQSEVLLQLKGSGTKSSQTFTAPSSWTLAYTYDCSNFDNSGNFQVYIQSADGGFNDLSPVNELGASGSDTEYYHSGGQFYLEVNSECDWTVTAKS